jgi:Niemann-Pick C1 protein
LFVNVTATEPKGDKLLVTELDQLVSDKYVDEFYDSCKDIKFGATGGKAMDLIGGGAKNGSEFVKFLGEKKFLGSPFQINFPKPDKEEYPGMSPRIMDAKPCNSTDEKFRCACVDCNTACPTLPAVAEVDICRVGYLPCLSFAVIIIYSVFIALLILAVSGHVAYAQHSKSKNERMRLLQDSSPSSTLLSKKIQSGCGCHRTPKLLRRKHFSMKTLDHSSGLNKHFWSMIQIHQVQDQC